MTIRRTVLHRALYRPNLILGGERELVLTSALVAGGLVVSAQNWVAATVGVAVWLVALWALRLMAKADPQMSRVYLRQLRYRGYYAPQSRPFRKEG